MLNPSSSMFLFFLGLCGVSFDFSNVISSGIMTCSFVWIMLARGLGTPGARGTRFWSTAAVRGDSSFGDLGDFFKNNFGSESSST